MDGFRADASETMSFLRPHKHLDAWYLADAVEAQILTLEEHHQLVASIGRIPCIQYGSAHTRQKYHTILDPNLLMKDVNLDLQTDPGERRAKFMLDSCPFYKVRHDAKRPRLIFKNQQGQCRPGLSRIPAALHASLADHHGGRGSHGCGAVSHAVVDSSLGPHRARHLVPRLDQDPSLRRGRSCAPCRCGRGRKTSTCLTRPAANPCRRRRSASAKRPTWTIGGIKG